LHDIMDKIAADKSSATGNQVGFHISLHRQLQMSWTIGNYQ